MAIRPIVRFGHSALHSPSPPVPSDGIDASIRKLVSDMTETMYAAPGIGLAAPQVAVALRVIVIDLSVGADRTQLIHLINPEITESEGAQCEDEGCLSVPGFGGSPVRPARVVVQGLDIDGKRRLYEGTGLLARAFSHEIDHVDGLLFVDRLPPLRRSLLERKLRRKARSGWDA